MACYSHLSACFWLFPQHFGNLTCTQSCDIMMTLGQVEKSKSHLHNLLFLILTIFSSNVIPNSVLKCSLYLRNLKQSYLNKIVHYPSPLLVHLPGHPIFYSQLQYMTFIFVFIPFLFKYNLTLIQTEMCKNNSAQII